MRIQLILLTLLFSSLAFASSDKEVRELFFKYDAVMETQKVELIDEVFTQKFLKEVGGKEEFIQNIKELPKKDEKSLQLSKMSWKKGTKDEVYFAKKVSAGSEKSKNKQEHGGASFILVKENGNLKIDGTISDDH